MDIKVFFNEETTSNTYLIEKKSKKYIIDPGSLKMNKLLEYIKSNNFEIEGIILTHGHYDHIIGIPTLIDELGINKIYISNIEKEFLYNPRYSLLFYSDLDQKVLEESLSKVEIIELIPDSIFEDFEIIHTPGHTKGGICLYDKDEKVLISGDTMFKGTYGRVDLPTGNSREMRDSIYKLLKLDKNTVVYPGHGGSTTIEQEYNIYYSGF